ncbi:endonuclease III [bacterium endosymbiont of Pedicinus badii]|uniref:endonuclease III n=1 Tax=bacterium endosymbiont of Pedicinus badii TaxID=1719126 RepID=UPI0009BAF1DF|nr:endonuclease III [bacterium endosymbiont of Pedicinus badii]OQM34402.1 endonuclease III [bacterium endosymbiont of Pedicinus badii]
MNNKKRKEILLRFYSNNPTPKVELSYKTEFEFLVSAVLSARAKDSVVNRITKKLFKLANTPKLIIKLGYKKLEKIIYPIGFFRKKTVNIIKICKILLKDFNGKVPNKIKNLKILPGVGRKTANLIASTIFKKNTIAIDTHVYRVCNRTKFAIAKNIPDMQKILDSKVPKKFKPYINNWFVLHGRYICTSKNPFCISCNISDLCEYKKKFLFFFK